MNKKLKFILLTSLVLILPLAYTTIYYKSSQNTTIVKRTSENTNIDYVIDLKKFNIYNNNTNAKDTTIGINNALDYAHSQGFKIVSLPKGHYSIDTSVVNPITLSDSENEWTHNRQGISMQSDMELIMDGAILEMVPTNDPYYSIFTISNCTNSKITGGTILGDRDKHDYGMRINSNGNELETGSYDELTGKPLADDTKTRTKDFIDNFKGESLPQKMYLTVLEKTSKNTVDGGVRYIYCYDKDENYLGLATGGNGFIKQGELLPNTDKIKVSFKDENRLDSVYYITDQGLYFTHEFGAGITIADSNNIEINNVTVKDTIGDCVTTIAPPLKVTVDNLKIINSTFENARRQGISLVATGENYLIQGCNIGKINGTDPQSGIDLEHYDYVKNVVINNCNFYDNKKWDIINYNGQDIEVKNSNFTGGIGSTYGYNMNIHNNNFTYEDVPSDPKIHNAVFALNTNTEDDSAYFKVNNNTIKNYPSGSTSSLNQSEFIGNKVYDSSILISSPNVHSNIYENSTVSYSTSNIKNEVFKNSICAIHDDKYSTIIEDCKFDDSQFMPRGSTTIKNSVIKNKSKPFGDTTAWWSLERNTKFENCDITTEYTKDIQFLSSYASNTLFKDCKLNLSRYLFSINYGKIGFDNCNIKFNNINNTNEVIDFDKVGYDKNTNIWSFNNCNISSDLPMKINTLDKLNNKVNNNIVVD